MKDDFIGTDQKIPDCLIQIIIWERLKLQLGQVLNLCLVAWTLAQVMPFWACDFLFNSKFYDVTLQCVLLGFLFSVFPDVISHDSYFHESLFYYKWIVSLRKLKSRLILNICGFFNILILLIFDQIAWPEIFFFLAFYKIKFY